MNLPIVWKIILCSATLLNMAFWSHQVFAEESPSKIYIIGYTESSAFHLSALPRVKAMYERAGFNVEFTPLPAKRSLKSANKGNVDGDMARVSSILETYHNLYKVDAPLIKHIGLAFTINPTLKTVNDQILKQYTVGARRGVRWSEDRLKNIEAFYVNDNETLFKMLLIGRLDIILVAESSSSAILKKLGKKASNVRQLEPIQNSTTTHHYVHKKNKAIIPRLEKALLELIKEEGWEF